MTTQHPKAPLYMGFMEVIATEESVVSTTVKGVPLDELFSRMTDRLSEIPPGARVRIDLVPWGERQ